MLISQSLVPMYRTIATFILIFFSMACMAQDATTDTLKKMSDNNEFDKITEQYAATPDGLSAASLYYVGYAYYMKQEDSSCIRFMDLSINKYSKDPRPHFMKASTLNYMQQYEAAIPVFKNAIKLAPDSTEYYSGLGDAYYNLEKMDLALETYKVATQQKKMMERPFLMVAQIYSDGKQITEALEAFYYARSKMPRGTGSYHHALFNIGQLEISKGNDEKGEAAFLELIASDPSDFHAYAKLIQIYYRGKAYDKAKPYKASLYEAYHKGLLKDNMKDMFCFDQFNWNDKLVQVFERYEEGPKSKIFEKHRFYIVNKNDSIEFKIQTEYSPVSVEMGGPKYILCSWKNSMHINYAIGYNDDLNYDDLKKRVIQILDKEIKPVATLQ